MPRIPVHDVRELLLSVAREQAPQRPTDASLQQGTLLAEVARRLKAQGNPDIEEAILTQWHDLMRTGIVAWGYNITNPNPPFFHFTDRGRRALERLSRDPANPAGYLKHLSAESTINPVASAYLIEGLECFAGGLDKAAAVMVGAAAESLILELRDTTLESFAQKRVAAPRGLSDWRVKTILDELHAVLDARKAAFPRALKEEFEAYWMAFAQQIRATRNDAGHPTSIDPVTEQSVHAAFLAFPELARMTTNLSNWIKANF